MPFGPSLVGAYFQLGSWKTIDLGNKQSLKDLLLLRAKATPKWTIRDWPGEYFFFFFCRNVRMMKRLRKKSTKNVRLFSHFHPNIQGNLRLADEIKCHLLGGQKSLLLDWLLDNSIKKSQKEFLNTTFIFRTDLSKTQPLGSYQVFCLKSAQVITNSSK